MTHIELDEIFERDIDLMVMREFYENDSFRAFFLGELGIESNSEVIHEAHSLYDEDGESDLTFIVESEEQTIGILVENKINAIAQPDQAARYTRRGNKGIERGDYQSFCTVIIAPSEYLEGNSEAKKYEHQISYEAIGEHLSHYSFSYKMLERALKKKGKGYEPHEAKEMTAFHDALYDYVKAYYPSLTLSATKGEKKGPGSTWFSFRTPVKNVWIIYKSDRNYIDMEFRGLGDKYQEFQGNNHDVLDSFGNLRIRRAGKSLAVEVDVDRDLDCFQPFIEQIAVIEEAMNKIVYLQNNVLPKLKF